MNRFAFARAAALVGCWLVAPAVFAQTKAAAQQPVAKAAPTAQAPAAPAKYYRPVKGRATIDIIQTPTKKVGSEIVTVIKIKNTSPGSIALLRVDEYVYDKNLKVVTGGTERWRKPFNPGEIIEITLRSPYKADMFKSQYQFSHANGDIKTNSVKSFDDPKAAATKK